MNVSVMTDQNNLKQNITPLSPTLPKDWIHSNSLAPVCLNELASVR